MIRPLATLVLVCLVGACATTTADCTDLEKGVCKITGTRLLTDSGITLTTPQGLALTFSSKPDQAGTQAALQALSATVGVLVKLLVPVAGSPTLDARGVARSADTG